ncbi:MAG: LPXTG cell wall anchor domain-containing protein, partial [Verrucomicrobiota bacterium]
SVVAAAMPAMTVVEAAKPPTPPPPATVETPKSAPPPAPVIAQPVPVPEPPPVAKPLTPTAPIPVATTTPAQVTNAPTVQTLAVTPPPQSNTNLLIAGLLILGAAGWIAFLWHRKSHPSQGASLITQSMNLDQDKKRRS